MSDNDAIDSALQARLCGGAGGIRQRLFAWILHGSGARIERYLGSYKSRLFQGISGTVLEIGAGTGANMPYFSGAINWIGVEPNRFMHRRLSEQAQRFGIQARVKYGAAEQLPVADESVDVVVSTLVLCSVVDQRRTLLEIIRVLKPGGRFIFIEHVAAPDGTRLRKLQKWITPLWSSLGDGCHPDRETYRVLQQAGFARIDAERFTAPFPIVGPHVAGVAFKADPSG